MSSFFDDDKLISQTVQGTVSDGSTDTRVIGPLCQQFLKETGVHLGRKTVPGWTDKEHEDAQELLTQWRENPLESQTLEVQTKLHTIIQNLTNKSEDHTLHASASLSLEAMIKEAE